MRDQIFYRTGHTIVGFLDYMGKLTLFFLETCRTLSRPPYYVREIIMQVYHLGVKTVSLVAVTALALGLVLAMQMVSVLAMFGAKDYTATTVVFTFFRGMGPLLAGIMLASRGGAGIGAELGSMRVTSQIDALTVSAVNPLKYLVFTRIAACMLIMPLLTIIANLIGVLGGMIIGLGQVGMTFSYYYHLTVKYLELRDLLPGVFKTLVFGLIIGTVACYHGYTTSQGTFGVGQSTKNSVVVSILLILISDVFLTKLTILIFPE